METRKLDELPKASLAEQVSVVEKAYDPGWNDPPPMSYESASGPVKKGILNKPKRIAFPLEANHSPTGLASPPRNVLGSSVTSNLPPISTYQSPVPPLSMPPMHTGTPPIGKSANTEVISLEHNDANNTSISNSTEKERSLESVQAVFSSILETINEIKDVTEIKKRLGIMTQMWNSNKLDVKVQQQMFLLSEALEKGCLTDANEIQKSLVVNHTSQCSTWMAGVRKLVQYASSENSTLLQQPVDLGKNENIGNVESVAAGSDVSDVNILASKVQDL